MPDAEHCFFMTDAVKGLKNAEFNPTILQMPVTNPSSPSWEYEAKDVVCRYCTLCMNPYVIAEPDKGRALIQKNLRILADCFDTTENVPEVRLYMLAKMISEIAGWQASLAIQVQGMKRSRGFGKSLPAVKTL